MGWPKDPIKNAEARKRASESKKGQVAWNKGKPFSEESRHLMSLAHKGNQSAVGHVVSDEQKRKTSEAKKGNKNFLGHKHTQETRARISESKRGATPWNKGIPHAEDTRTKLIQASRIRWDSPESDANRKMLSETHSGDKSPFWKGGTSFDPYCEKFNEALKESVRAKFNRTCYLCSTTETAKKLSIHHNDYNKMQGCGNRPWNLIPLCSKCHPRTNHNRWYWFALLYNYWALNPEFNF